MKKRLLKFDKFEVITRLKPGELVVTYDDMFGKVTSYQINALGDEWYRVKVRMTHYRPYTEILLLHKNDLKRIIFK